MVTVPGKQEDWYKQEVDKARKRGRVFADEPPKAESEEPDVGWYEQEIKKATEHDKRRKSVMLGPSRGEQLPHDTPRQDDYSQWREQTIRRRAARFNRSLRIAQRNPIDTELAVRIFRLQAKTGLSQDLIQARFETIEEEVLRFENEFGTFDRGKWARWSPTFLDYASEHPNFHHLADKEDIPKLVNMEELANRDRLLWPKPDEEIEREARMLARMERQSIMDSIERRQGYLPLNLPKAPKVPEDHATLESLRDQLDRDEGQVAELERETDAQKAEEFADTPSTTFERFETAETTVPVGDLIEVPSEEYFYNKWVEELRAEEAFYAGTDEISFIEQVKERYRENRVFYLPYISGIVDMSSAVGLWRSMLAVEAGEATELQRNEVLRFGRMAMAREYRGEHWSAFVASILTELPSFGAEIATSGPVFKAIYEGLRKGGQEAVEGFLKRTVRKAFRNKLVAGTFGFLGQTSVARPAHIIKDAVGYMSPQGYLEMEDGRIAWKTIPDTGDPFWVAFPKGLVRETTEIATESLSRLPVFKALDKALDSGINKVFFGWWLKSNPGKGGRAFAKWLDAARFGGLPSELAEEEVNKLVLAMTGIEPYQLTTPKELLAMSLAFGAPLTLRGIMGAFGGQRVVRNPAPETDIIDTMAQQIREVKVRERAPEVVEERVKEMVRGTQNENRWIPSESFVQFYQEQKDEQGRPRNPRDEYIQMMGTPEAGKQYDEAVRHKTDLQVPAEKYLMRIGVDEQAHNFFREEMRRVPEEMNRRETQALQKQVAEMQEAAARPVEESVQQIESRVEKAMIEGKVEKAAARRKAELVGSVFRSMGSRANVDPLFLFERFPIEAVIRDEFDELAREAGIAAVEQPPIISARVAINRLSPEQIEAPTPLPKEITAARLIGPSPTEARPQVPLSEFLGAVVPEGAPKDLMSSLSSAGVAIRTYPKGTTQTQVDTLARELQREVAIEHKLFQVPPFGPARGSLQFGPDLDAFIIRVFRNGDMSTILHEMGHYFLSVFSEIATASDAPAQIRADYQEILDWFATRSMAEVLAEVEAKAKQMEARAKADPENKALRLVADVHREAFEFAKAEGGAKFMKGVAANFGQNVERFDHRAILTTPFQEMWAQHFESYLATGKAPTTKLRAAFRKFREWIVAAYRFTQSRFVAVPDNIKQVMDRMVATEEELAAARGESSMSPLFVDPRLLGMKEEKAINYLSNVAFAQDVAFEEAVQLTMQVLRRQQSAQVRKTRARLRPEAEQIVNSSPIHVAMAAIMRGKLPDGSDLPVELAAQVKGVKLERRKVVEDVGEEIADLIPSKMMAKQGVSLDEAAELFGFTSGEHFKRELFEAIEAERQSSPMAAREPQLRIQMKSLDEQRRKLELEGEKIGKETAEVKKRLRAGRKMLGKRLSRTMRADERASVVEIREILGGIVADGKILPVFETEVLPKKYRSKTGRPSDEVAQEFSDRGVIPDPHSDTLFEWISLAEAQLQRSSDRLKAIPAEAQRLANTQITMSIEAMIDLVGQKHELRADLHDVKKQEAELRRQVLPKSRITAIERLTDQLVQQELGDLASEEDIREQAMQVVHNDKQALVFHLEMQHLLSKDFATWAKLTERVAGRIPRIDVLKDEARRFVAEQKAGETFPGVWQRGVQKMGQEAATAMAREGWAEAFAAKRKQAIMHERYIASRDQKKRNERTIKYFSKFGKKSVREALPHDEREQIDQLLDRIEIRSNVSPTAEAERKALATWIAGQKAMGYDLGIPERFINEGFRTHWKNLTNEELNGLRDTVKQIEHIGRERDRLIKSARKQRLVDIRMDMEGSLGQFFDLSLEPVDITRGLKHRIVGGLRKGMAAHTKMEFLFEHMDGERPSGPAWQYLFKPFADAEFDENTRNAEVGRRMAELRAPYSYGERVAMFRKKYEIPDAGTSIIKGVFTKMNMIMVALNMGNPYNLNALMEGYGWSRQQLQTIIDRLDRRDWAFVQGIWELIDSFWPEARQLEIDMTGTSPEKVEALPLETKYGTVRGGYFPIIFDGQLSHQQAKLDERAHVKEMFGGNWATAMTKHNHLKERVNTGGKPLLLEFTALTNHLSAVVHDLSFRRAVVDVSKLVNDREIRAILTRAVGREMVDQLNPWIHAIARDRRSDYAHWMEKAAGKIRTPTTIVNLGLKMTSGILQTLGFTRTLKELGPKYSAIGVRRTFGIGQGMQDAIEFVMERSKVMPFRMQSYDRDVRDVTRKMASVIPDTKKAWFYHIGLLDMSVAMPTWHGAYSKAMDGNVPNVEKGNEPAAIDFADSRVRITQSAGAAKDLAAVQRGGEAWRLFTMFYSEMSIQYNQYAKTVREFKLTKDAPKLIGSLAALWFVPAILEDLIRGNAPDDPDDLWTWALEKEVFYPLDTVIFARDISRSAQWYLKTGRSEFQGSPAFESMVAALYAAAVPVKLVSKEDVTRQEVRGTVMAAGFALGLPSRQMWLSGEHLFKLMTGRTQAEDPISELWRTIVTGEKRKRAR